MIIDLGPELFLVVEERQRVVTRLGHEFARPGFRQLPPQINQVWGPARKLLEGRPSDRK